MFQDNQQSRQMVKGNWKCEECSKEITELPFEPSGDRPIFCQECWREKRSQGSGGGGGDFQRRERQMFQGDWECADCGKKITELPFKPSGDRPVLCVDCWKAKRS